jgi:hypothetical protein
MAGHRGYEVIVMRLKSVLIRALSPCMFVLLEAVIPASSNNGCALGIQ